MCAKVTGLPAARVVARVRRMGGGFGGKETRSVFVSVCAAAAAVKLNRPVRMSLHRDVDMSASGGRHAFVAKWRAAASRPTAATATGACPAPLHALPPPQKAPTHTHAAHCSAPL